MQAYDLAIPILPSRSVNETALFYRRLGFEGGPHESDAEYAILRRGSVVNDGQETCFSGGERRFPPT